MTKLSLPAGCSLILAVGGSGGVPPVFDNPPPFQPVTAMLRRLTRAQFHNAVFADPTQTELGIDGGHVTACLPGIMV
jgi:hypothetical protein